MVSSVRELFGLGAPPPPKPKYLQQTPVSDVNSIQPVAPTTPREGINYDTIMTAIVRVRQNELMGKGKLSKDEHLAENLYALVRHHVPNSPLTYERIEQAINFVKSNAVMGAGKWSKEEHLAEYLYALVRLGQTSASDPSVLTNVGEIREDMYTNTVAPGKLPVGQRKAV